MPETLSTPKLLLDWLAAMRDAGDLAPMLVAIRGGAIVASGFTDPHRWSKDAAIAFYGFEADVVALAMDTWVHTSPADTPEPGVDPAELYITGNPDTSEALAIEWLDRNGPSVIVIRRYDRTDGGLVWHEPDPPRSAGGAAVSPHVVRDALAQTEDRHGHADFFKSLPADDRDRATACHLGLELHT